MIMALEEFVVLPQSEFDLSFSLLALSVSHTGAASTLHLASHEEMCGCPLIS